MLLGGLGHCDEARFGGTEYAKVILKQLWGLPPALDMEYEKRVQAAMREIAAAGLAESAHDLSDGGLAVAAAECCLRPGGAGASLALDSDLGPELLLFHEGPSRILLSTSNPDAVAAIAGRHRVEALAAGVTIESGLEIRNRNSPLLSVSMDSLRTIYEGSLESQLRS